MNNFLFSLILFVSFITGLTVIVIAQGLQKKYRLNYLSSYLYFLIFINVFGVYGIIGQAIARKILELRQTPFETMETIGHFFSFLGIPFLILAWYMFLRFCWEILNKNIPRRLTLGYFFALAVVFLAYGGAIILANLSPWQDRQYALFSSAVVFLYGALEAFVLVVGLTQLLSRARTLDDQQKQKAVRGFSFISLYVYSLSLVLLPLFSPLRDLSPVYALAFFSAHLLPLLYLKTYLQRHYVAPSLQKTPPQIMARFLEDYKISKREEEVIRELCAGKTNREISETLFISLQTVKDHIYRVYLKTDVKNRVQLINLIQSYGSSKESDSLKEI